MNKILKQISLMVLITFLTTVVLGGSGWGKLNFYEDASSSKGLNQLDISSTEAATKEVISVEKASSKENVSNTAWKIGLFTLFAALGGSYINQWASTNPMAAAITFVFGVIPLAIFATEGTSMIFNVINNRISGIKSPEPQEFVNYEGWIKASMINPSEVEIGKYAYIENEGFLYEEPAPPGKTIIWLKKNLKCEILEKRQVVGNSWFFRWFNDLWLRIKTQEIDRIQYPKGYENLEKK